MKNQREEVKIIDENLSETQVFYQAFNAVGTSIYIVDNQRRIVFANQMLIEMLGYKTRDEVVGKSPKELMLCGNPEQFFCDEGIWCQKCEISNRLDGQEDVILEKVVYKKEDNYTIPIHVKQHLSKLEMEGRELIVVTVDNVTDTVRKRMLERLFYHDIVNTTGALKGILQLLRDEAPDDMRPDIDFVYDSFQYLINEIQAQKQITDAENDQLILQMEEESALVILKSVQELFVNHKAAEDKSIQIDKHIDDFIIHTDLALLRRVLGNMLKNALEASNRKERVTLGCKLIGKKELTAEFWTHNKAVIPKEIQNSLFSQMVSTKGNNRGFGTYGMKLITEKYLQGTVGFHSDEEKGTTFYIRIPCGSK